MEYGCLFLFLTCEGAKFRLDLFTVGFQIVQHAILQKPLEKQQLANGGFEGTTIWQWHGHLFALFVFVDTFARIKKDFVVLQHVLLVGIFHKQRRGSAGDGVKHVMFVHIVTEEVLDQTNAGILLLQQLIHPHEMSGVLLEIGGRFLGEQLARRQLLKKWHRLRQLLIHHGLTLGHAWILPLGFSV